MYIYSKYKNTRMMNLSIPSYSQTIRTNTDRIRFTNKCLVLYSVGEHQAVTLF